MAAYSVDQNAPWECTNSVMRAVVALSWLVSASHAARVSMHDGALMTASRATRVVNGARWGQLGYPPVRPMYSAYRVTAKAPPRPQAWTLSVWAGPWHRWTAFVTDRRVLLYRRPDADTNRSLSIMNRARLVDTPSGAVESASFLRGAGGASPPVRLLCLGPLDVHRAGSGAAHRSSSSAGGMVEPCMNRRRWDATGGTTARATGMARGGMQASSAARRTFANGSMEGAVHHIGGWLPGQCVRGPPSAPHTSSAPHTGNSGFGPAGPSRGASMRSLSAGAPASVSSAEAPRTCSSSAVLRANARVDGAPPASTASCSRSSRMRALTRMTNTEGRTDAGCAAGPFHHAGPGYGHCPCGVCRSWAGTGRGRPARAPTVSSVYTCASGAPMNAGEMATSGPSGDSAPRRAVRLKCWRSGQGGLARVPRLQAHPGGWPTPEYVFPVE